ncbi:hypothetical protein [Peristeroidobacter soli]|jgi:hypothetical protein|uniref:hypothetical protein n=1 Tax=Peristeroidobacter soli TaxID=2497877 RepID=UPI00101D732E|nr:hypothetical protein [Peristeroidobacter soli]
MVFWIRFRLLAAACLMLAACDMNPDPKFAEKRAAADSANLGDRYALLDHAPDTGLYGWWPADEAPARAAAEAVSQAQRYAVLLGTLKEQEQSLPPQPSLAGCSQRFQEVVDYASGNGDRQSASAPHALVEKLLRCREAAIAIEDPDSDELASYLGGVRKFASTGTIIVGMRCLNGPDRERCLEHWSRGARLLGKDKEGFRLTLDKLRG